MDADGKNIDSIHLWLDDHSYRVTREKIQAEFGIKITQSKLHRYNQKRDLVDQICGEEEFQVDMKQWYDLINGNPVPYDQATLKLISKKVFEYLLHPANKITVTGLNMLHRIATYETTLDLQLRRLALAEHKQGLTQTRNSKPAPEAKPAPSTSESKSTPPAVKPGLVFPSPMDSIITPPPSIPPVGPDLVSQILRQLPKDLAQKPKLAMAA